MTFTPNGKDHKQIITSLGKYPGSSTTQEAVIVKVETGSVSVTARNPVNRGCNQGWMKAEHGWGLLFSWGALNSMYGNR